MLSSTSTSSPPSCNVANRKAKDGRKLKRLWRCKFGACQQQRAPTGNGIGGRCLMSVEAQAADDVRRFVRISNIGRPRTPRQPDQKSPTKRVARARQSLRNVNGTSEGQACDSKVGGRQRRLTSNACLEPTNYKLQTTNYKEFRWPREHPVSNLATAPIRRQIAASGRFRSAIDPRKTSVEMCSATPVAGSLARAPCPRRQTTAPRRYRLSSSGAGHPRTPH
jgi:hypothetical protein